MFSGARPDVVFLYSPCPSPCLPCVCFGVVCFCMVPMFPYFPLLLVLCCPPPLCIFPRLVTPARTGHGVMHVCIGVLLNHRLSLNVSLTSLWLSIAAIRPVFKMLNRYVASAWGQKGMQHLVVEMMRVKIAPPPNQYGLCITPGAQYKDKCIFQVV